MDGCLDDNDIQAFFRGQLSASRTTVVQRHVDSCSMCRHLVAEVARSTEGSESSSDSVRQRDSTRARSTEGSESSSDSVRQRDSTRAKSTSEHDALPSSSSRRPSGVGRSSAPTGMSGMTTKKVRSVPKIVIRPSPSPMPSPLAALSPTPQERVVIRDGKVSRRPSGLMQTAPVSSGSGRRAKLEAGDVLEDRYRLERILGEGGTGIVWEATHIVMRRRVAVKVHKSRDPKSIRRFFREARVTAALRHPNIVEVHDVFTIPEMSSAAMVMELLHGLPLSTMLRADDGRERVQLSIEQTARVLLPVIDALAAAHAAGVVHRDLKPENVFLVGERPLEHAHVKVLDFGLAKLTATEGDVMSSGQLTRSGFVLGTPHYMSPEQVSGDSAIDTRTDLWSLGVILYECLSGVRPIEADNISHLFRAVLESKITPLSKRVPSLPKPLAQVTMRLLSRPREERPTLAEVHDALARA